MEWVYESTLDPAECFTRLLCPQKPFEDEINPANVECVKISETKVHFVYKGKRFSKFRRSEYLMDFLPNGTVSSGTKITITFQHEMFNLPMPMTPVQDLDRFMKAILNAYRRV